MIMELESYSELVYLDAVMAFASSTEEQVNELVSTKNPTSVTMVCFMSAMYDATQLSVTHANS
jgi:hypothetical protein